MASEPPSKIKRQLSGFKKARQPSSETVWLNAEYGQQITTEKVIVAGVDETTEMLEDNGYKHLEKVEEMPKRQKTNEDASPHLPHLSSAEDISSDQAVQHTLRLTTSVMSWKWLRRLPSALRYSKDLNDPVRAAALDACHASLPHLLSDENKAVSLLAKIANSLCWYEVEGPVPVPGPVQSSSCQQSRQIREWDEAYRSLWVLLRQGVVPSFCLEAERFSVMVFGDGGGTWTSPSSGQQVKPSRSEPCAILWPSIRELRSMLQENHVYFDMPPRSLQRQASTAEPPRLAGDGASGLRAVVPLSKGCSDGEAAVSDTTRQDLLELRRAGVRAKTPGDGDYFTNIKSALCFQGGWRVHLLLNVLRQHFLGQPMPAAVKMHGPKLSAWQSIAGCELEPHLQLAMQAAEVATPPRPGTIRKLCRASWHVQAFPMQLPSLCTRQVKSVQVARAQVFILNLWAMACPHDSGQGCQKPRWQR